MTKLLPLLLCACGFTAGAHSLWEIGTSDNSAAEFALGPSDYEEFLAADFGYEDRVFIIGNSDISTGFPYVLPGPDDMWGGSGGAAGTRTHEINILFSIDRLPNLDSQCKLVIDLVDSQPKGSVVKVTVNSIEKRFEIKGTSGDAVYGKTTSAREQILEFPFSNSDLRKGGNVITISVIEGSWIVFDQVRLEGNGIKLTEADPNIFLRDVAAANYEITNHGVRVQPLLIDVEHVAGNPTLTVELDGTKVFEAPVDSARYIFEAPMPAVESPRHSNYRILVNNKTISEGSVERAPQTLYTPADYVDTKIGSAHSRWMIAPGPWMPFSMVKLSPDNQNTGWQAGYQPSIESIACFSHIHEWTMAGLGMMPTNGKLFTSAGNELRPDEGYRSRIDKKTEEAPLGHYKIHLTDTDICAEITATERASFQRYTFPSDKDGRVMIDLHIQAEYDYELLDVAIRQVSNYRIEGYSHQLTPQVWSNDADQEYIVNFVIEFDAPIKNIGGWINDTIVRTNHISGKKLRDAGMFVEFDTKKNPVVQTRTGISLVSVENAAENLQTEISKPFGWDFEAVVKNQKNVWNDILNRVAITTDNKIEKTRFYTNMYRAMCRNVWSDVNGQWRSPDEQVRQLDRHDDVAMGCDAFWNTFWNLNQFWNLATPEWSSRWVKSQLALYDACGWLAKGPAGMEYIPVMVAEHEIPLIVSAYQMGIRDFDTEKAFEAMKKMQTTPATRVAGGFAGNRDIEHYMKHHYVPIEKGRFSNSLEYSFDDWTVGQMAKALGKTDDFEKFNTRGNWWRNAINPANGFAHMRDSAGNFVPDFDPFRSGANHHYVEGNAWQLSFFVPQNIPALIDIIGKDTFVDRLNGGFMASEPWRYNSPGDKYWDYPVVQGNQQSMHFAFLFNWAGKPWLTQKWSRSIIDRYYGAGIANAYLGDEDQGQMSAWFVMAALGLFQTDGGCNATPIYEIASPLFKETVIDLGNRYNRGKTFSIKANNVSRRNKYVQSAMLNGKTLNSFWFPASELLKGGELILEMGPEPNTRWGAENLRPQ